MELIGLKGFKSLTSSYWESLVTCQGVAGEV